MKYAAFLGGTEMAYFVRPTNQGGSYPPGCHGWHRSNRPVPFHSPRISPYLRKAPIIYPLQLGSNRQVGPIKGLIVHW